MIMTVWIHRRWFFLLGLTLAGFAVLPVQAQSTQQAQQLSQVNHLREQVRSNALREQQRQQTGSTIARAFKSQDAKTQLQSVDQARHDRYQARQRNMVNDYQSKPKAVSKPTHGGSASAKPAHAGSSH